MQVRNYVLVAGVASFVMTIAAAINAFASVAAILMIVMLYSFWVMVQSRPHSGHDFNKDPIAPYLLIAVGVSCGTMMMDGSPLLFAANVVMALLIGAFASAAVIYYVDAQDGETVVWRDVRRITYSLGLPIAGLGLTQYLVETDRSVISGLIMIAGLTWFGWKIAPRTFIRVRQRPQLAGS